MAVNKNGPKAEKQLRAHPFMIFAYLKPYLFVLLLPLLRGLLNYGASGALPRLIIGEAALSVLIASAAVVKWLRCRLILSGDRIRIREGLFLHKESIIPKDKISSLFMETRPLLWLFRGIVVRFDTEAGRPGKSDFDLILPLKRTSLLLELLPPRPDPQHPDPDRLRQYHAPAFKMLIMAAATSSSATGLLLAAPVINKAGQLLGDGFSERFYGAVTEAAGLLETVIPTGASVLAILLLAGFAVSFLHSLVTTAPFRLYIKGDRFTSASGLIARRRTRFRAGAINDVWIQQTPAMRLVRHYTVKVSVAGYGKGRGETAVVIPAAGQKEIKGLLEDILPHAEQAPIALRPPARALSRFAVWPVVWLLAIPAAGVFAARLLPDFSGFIRFSVMMLMVIQAIMVSLSLRRYTHGGVTFGSQITAYSSKCFSLTEMRCPGDRAGVIRIMQLPFDFLVNLCRVKITVRSESAHTLTVPHLDYKQVKKTLETVYKTRF
ncbi:MAG: PH domain-containing protein [Clostridiales bacterium]|nr:PH domain-containing protein [Clostridiales bacterium]